MLLVFTPLPMAIYLNEGQLTCRPLVRYSLGLHIYLYVQLIHKFEPGPQAFLTLLTANNVENCFEHDYV